MYQELPKNRKLLPLIVINGLIVGVHFLEYSNIKSYHKFFH